MLGLIIGMMSILPIKDLAAFMDFLGARPLYLISKFANRVYSDVDYTADDDQFFILGKKRRGFQKALCVSMPKMLADPHE